MRPFQVWSLVVPLLAFGQSATAQELAQDRAPRFLLALDSRLTPVDIDRTPLLGRRLSLSLDGATIKEALGEIGRQSGLRLAYGDDVLPRDGRVHLRAEGITVVAALTDVLFDTDVDVVFSPNGRATLVRRPDRTQGGTVAGRVTDAKSGKAVANVSVVLEGTRWRASTGEDGAYRLLDVTAGAYTLTASRIGYTKQSQSVTVAAGQEVTVNLGLAAAPTELERVVVTGTVTPTQEKALPTPISVITGDEIQQKGYQRVDQIFRGEIPGAIAWDNGAWNYYSDISIRGATSFGANEVKTYIDGVEVADFDKVATIDPSTIDRIEVLRGPEGSTIYGSDASGGVMQIFTKKGTFNTPNPRVEAKVSAGVIQSQWDHVVMQDHSLAVSGGSQDFAYRLGGGWIHYGDWLPGAHSTNGSLSGSVTGTQGPVTIGVSARYYSKTFGLAENPAFTQISPAFTPYDETYLWRQQTYGLTFAYTATPRWHHNLVLGYDRSGHDFYTVQRRLVTPADTFLPVSSLDDNKTSVAYNTTYAVHLGRAVQSSLTAGADHYAFHTGGFFKFNATTTTNTISSPQLGYRSQYDNTGYFAQEQLAFWDAAFLTLGLRIENNTNFGKNFGTAWEPRAGVSYVRAIGDLTAKVRVAYGKGTRPPFPGAGELIVTSTSQRLANPNLGPERQEGTDGGLDLYFGQRASLEATYYDQTAIDLIDNVVFSSSPYTYQFQNVGRVKNKGGEFQGRLNVGRFSLAGTYSITSSVVRRLSPTYSGDLKPGDRMLGIPKYTAGATVSYRAPRTVVALGATYVGWWIQYDNIALNAAFSNGTFTGSFRDYWMTYPAFTKFRLSVSQTVSDRLSVFLQSDNLTNRNLTEHDNTYPNQGRVTMLGLRTPSP